jgi:hypothetical protein
MNEKEYKNYLETKIIDFRVDMGILVWWEMRNYVVILEADLTNRGSSWRSSMQV